METCVNCACEFSDPYQNSDTHLKVSNVHEPLSTIYKLNYLTEFLDSENAEIWKLCENCLGLFTNLQQFYEDFNQLRSLESKLAIEIQKLDNCIQSHHQREKPDKQKQMSKVENTGINASHLKVIIHRLENDPVAQKYISNSNTTKPKKRTRKKKEKSTTIQAIDASLSNPKVEKNVSLPFQSNTHAKEVEEEADDSYFEDPLFVPSPQPEEEEGEEIGSDEHEEKHVPEKKKQKKVKSKNKVQDNTKKKRRKLAATPAEIAEAKKRAAAEGEIQRKYLKNYRTRRTQVPNPCWDCDMDFPTKDYCYQHTMREHCEPGEQYVCRNCSRRCKTPHLLKVHENQYCLKLKPGELLTIWKCEKCEGKGKIKTFPLKHILTQHMKKYHHEGELKCTVPGCNFTTTVRDSLNNHIRLNHPPEPQPIEERTCLECDKVFNSKGIYKLHYNKMHTPEGLEKYKEYLKSLKELRIQQNKDKPRIIDETFCSVCMVDMLTHQALVVHQKSVHGERLGNFVCDQCGQSFSKNTSLTKHKQYVHSQERRFFCEQCGKSFKRQASLKVHLRIAHDEEGRLKFNADTRLQTRRRKIRQQALAQSLLAGIPQFTGAQVMDSNCGNAQDNTMDDLSMLQNFGA